MPAGSAESSRFQPPARQDTPPLYPLYTAYARNPFRKVLLLAAIDSAGIRKVGSVMQTLQLLISQGIPCLPSAN